MSQHTIVQVTKFVTSDRLDDGVNIIQVEIPTPGPGEVLIRLKLRPVNPTDVHTIAGTRPIGPHKLPLVPGSEGLGLVVKNGSGAEKYKENQRVVGVPYPGIEGQGSWQQYVVVKEENLVPVPDNVSDAVAAQFLVNPCTAYGLLESSDVPKGGWLLQTAAASSLGKQIIALAHERGIRTINVVRRSNVKEELKQLGADEVIDTSSEDLVARVKEITGGKGAYAVIDAVAGPAMKQVVASLRPGGTALVYGSMTGEPAEYDAIDVLYTLKTLKGWLLFDWLVAIGDKKEQVLNEVWDKLEKKIIPLDVGEIFPLEEVKKAIAASLKPGRGGKIFLEG